MPLYLKNTEPQPPRCLRQETKNERIFPTRQRGLSKNADNKNAMADGCVKKHPVPTIKHEMMHIALEHCTRGVDIQRRLLSKYDLVPTRENMERVHFLVNLAMDAKVNHLLALE